MRDFHWQLLQRSIPNEVSLWGAERSWWQPILVLAYGGRRRECVEYRSESWSIKASYLPSLLTPSLLTKTLTLCLSVPRHGNALKRKHRFGKEKVGKEDKNPVTIQLSSAMPCNALPPLSYIPITLKNRASIE